MSENLDVVKEAKVFLAVAEAIKDLDEDGKRRIHNMLGLSLKGTMPNGITPTPSVTPVRPIITMGDLTLSDLGEPGEKGIELIVPDVKGANKRDASLRIAYLVCYLNEKILSNTTVARTVVYDQMRKYGAFDKYNSKKYITGEGMILKEKNGDELRLAVAGKTYAEKIISEIRDVSKANGWAPGRKLAKSKKTKAIKSAKSTSGK